MLIRHGSIKSAVVVMVTAALMLFLAPTWGTAATWLDLQTGATGNYYSARLLSMGGIGTAGPSSPFLVFDNPSLIFCTYPASGSFQAEAAGGMERYVEMRSFPVWDSFSSYLVDNVYAYNANYFGRGAAAVSQRFDLGGLQVGISAGFRPFADFDYKYTEYIRDNNSFAINKDELLGTNSLTSSGSLNEWTAGAALYMPGTLRLSIGLSVSDLSGNIDAESRVAYKPDLTEDLIAEHSRSLDGKIVRFGFSVRPGDHVVLGAAYRSGFSLDGDASWKSISPVAAVCDTTTPFHAEYPGRLSTALTFMPRNALRTRFSFEIGFEPWSGHSIDYGNRVSAADDSTMLTFDPASYEAPDSSLVFSMLPVPSPTEFIKNVWDFRVGVEHVFPNGVPLRFGLKMQPHVSDTSVRSAAFSAGSGWRTGNFIFDFGFEVKTAKYTMPDIFPDTLYSAFIADLESDRTGNDNVSDFSAVGFMSIKFINGS